MGLALCAALYYQYTPNSRPVLHLEEAPGGFENRASSDLPTLHVDFLEKLSWAKIR